MDKIITLTLSQQDVFELLQRCGEIDEDVQLESSSNTQWPVSIQVVEKTKYAHKTVKD
jgi:hypothetical protein